MSRVVIRSCDGYRLRSNLCAAAKAYPWSFLTTGTRQHLPAGTYIISKSKPEEATHAHAQTNHLIGRELAQHGPAALLGEPYVYSYHYKDTEELFEKLERAKNTPIDRQYARMTVRPSYWNLNADLQVCPTIFAVYPPV